MSTYNRTIRDVNGMCTIEVDVYCVLEAFNVTCPARAHAIKKILCAGQRGTKNTLTDLEEAMYAMERARGLEIDRMVEQQMEVEKKQPPKKRRK